MTEDSMRGKSEDGITKTSDGLKRRDLLLSGTSLVAASALLGASFATSAQAQLPTRTPPTGKQPNILVIMTDDVGIWNISAYHRGMMGGRTHSNRARRDAPRLFWDRLRSVPVY